MTRVLLVDDSENFRKLMVILLTQCTSVEVIGQAHDCHEARAAVVQLKPDVIILDLYMPGDSGLEVLRAVKREPHPPVVVICTSDPDPDCRRRCLEEGADFFMDKATDVNQWEQILATLTSRGCY